VEAEDGTEGVACSLTGDAMVGLGLGRGAGRGAFVAAFQVNLLISCSVSALLDLLMMTTCSKTLKHTGGAVRSSVQLRRPYSCRWPGRELWRDGYVQSSEIAWASIASWRATSGSTAAVGRRSKKLVTPLAGALCRRRTWAGCRGAGLVLGCPYWSAHLQQPAAAGTLASLLAGPAILCCRYQGCDFADSLHR
jgi:hypothetical protein